MKMKDLRGKIIHYAALKPWGKFFPAQFPYWHYFTQSPWGSETMQRLEERIFDPHDRIMPMMLGIWRNPALVPPDMENPPSFPQIAQQQIRCFHNRTAQPSGSSAAGTSFLVPPGRACPRPCLHVLCVTCKQIMVIPDRKAFLFRLSSRKESTLLS